MVDEEKIIEELKRGNKNRFKILYEKYSKSVYAVILNIVRNRAVAEDLLQITFVKLLNNIRSFDKDKGTFYNFVSKIGENTAIDYLKKVKIKVKEKGDGMEKIVDREITIDNGLLNLLKLDENVARTVEMDELMAELDAAIAELTLNQRMAIKWRCEYELPEKDCARIMGVSVGAFKATLHRARKTLVIKIRDKYPDLYDEIKTRKYVARMFVMIIIGVTAFTGLAYATYMICNEIWSKKTFTLSELRTEVPHENSIISKDVALEKMNFYLETLGEEKASADELKLIKDYQLYKVCWMIDRGNVILKIDSTNGELISYDSFYENDILGKMSVEELYKKLGLPEDYELCGEESVNDFKIRNYAKRYGDIYNFHERVLYIFSDNMLKTISVCNYDYQDKEILISKEDAIRIAEENNIEVDTIELSIEKITDLIEEPDSDIRFETSKHEEWEYVELFNESIKVKKVWKVIGNDRIILIDVNTGEVIKK